MNPERIDEVTARTWVDVDLGAIARNLGALAKRLPEQTERELPRNAYRVELDRHRLVWVTREGDKEVRYHSESDAGMMKRIKAQVISWLPIEWLL